MNERQEARGTNGPVYQSGLEPYQASQPPQSSSRQTAKLATSGTSSTPVPKQKTPDWVLFLTKFLRHGKAIASFVPSSTYLSRAVVQGLDFSRPQTVVELGAGTGPITAALLAQLKPPSRAIILERDKDFCDRLRTRFPSSQFPQAEIVEADAVHLGRLLAERGIDVVDHFLCGLPLPSFPARSRDAVLETVHRCMHAEGTFRQLTHMPWIYYPLYRRYFRLVDFRLVLRNFPPAGFYICTQPHLSSQAVG